MSKDEIELRKFEARFGLYKVIFGTFILGLAGILVPAAIEGWGLLFQKWQNEAQLEFQRQSRQEDFLKTHFSTAISESLDLRVRFAEYYAYTFDGYSPNTENGIVRSATNTDIGKWTRYYEALKHQRKTLRKDIIEKEALIRKLLSEKAEDRIENHDTKLALLEVELDWLYDEIEYSQPGREPKPRSSILSSDDPLIVLQIASYKRNKCSTAQKEINLYGKEAFGREPTLWLSPTETWVVVGGSVKNLSHFRFQATAPWVWCCSW